MHIYFIGQRGISSRTAENMNENRTHALANEAVRYGHKATIASTPSYSNEGRIRSHSFKLLSIPSLNPTVAGGYVYTAFSALASLFVQPNTIHVQGWAAAFFLRLLVPLLSKLSVIWTISDIPAAFPLSFVSFLASGFDRIISSNRTVQYHLLSTYSLKSDYIPDGYTPLSLPDVRPALFGLRKEQYGVVFAKNTAQLKQIQRIHASFKTNKKLIIFSEKPVKGIISLDLPPMSRSALSLIRQSAFVIITDPVYSEVALHALDAGRMVLATNNPLHEELLGTSASYYTENDMTQLHLLLKKGIKKHPLNVSGQLRARHHFQWEKIGQEYMRAYRHSKAVIVPFDSIVRKNSFQRAV